MQGLRQHPDNEGGLHDARVDNMRKGEAAADVGRHELFAMLQGVDDCARAIGGDLAIFPCSVNWLTR